ncbi:MAG: hypothetical protein M4D80_29890 [Myxococcota bacterium]|nr:hypothetical protein [Myxococcota bacterium]
MLRIHAALLIAAGCTSEGASVNLATGEVEPWQTAAPLPVARANHCSTGLDATVFVVGGNRKVGDTFAKTDEIHAGTIAPDGTITWALVGKTPSPVTECTATAVAIADGIRLYILDGLYDRESDARQVFVTDFVNGQLGPLSPFATLPQIATSSEATITSSAALLLMDSVLPADGDKTVTLRTSIAGAPAWSTDDWSIGFRAQAQFAFTDRFAYTLGGYKGDTGNPVTADVFVATIDAKTGAIGPARPTTPLPAPLSFGEAIAVDDYLFVAGGRGQVFGAAGVTSVYAAQIQDDGSLADWRTVAALPMGRTNHELALAGDFLVITGGAVSGPGDRNVFTARVRYPK